jgi:hypothetical protein
MLKFLLIPLLALALTASPAAAKTVHFSTTVHPQGNVDAERASDGLVQYVGDKFMEGGCWAHDSIWVGFPAVDCYAIFNARGQGWYVEYQALSPHRFKVTHREGGCKYKWNYLTVSGRHASLDLSEPKRYRHCIIPSTSL